MTTSSKPTACVRAIRAAGLASLVGWVAWIASRVGERPFWPANAAEVVAVLGWAAGLHAVLRAVEALTRTRQGPSWRDYARGYGLMLFCGWTFLFYFNAHRVGPLDAQWYENVMTDYLTQARAGTFPVVVGSSLYSFNGAVHPFRSAPWQFVLAHGVDLLSGRCLAPVAIQHLTAAVSYCAAVLILYVGFARSRPDSGWKAWVFALGYAMMPAATVPFFQFDMYMTLTAQPVMAVCMLCLQKVVEEESVTASGWLGVFLAALWYCHPPMALLMGLVSGLVTLGCVAVYGFTVSRVLGGAVCLALFGALAGPYFLSMGELAQSETARMATLGMPAAGLVLCLFSMAGFLRTRWLPWLGLLPSGILCLHRFQPSLVPFAACFAGSMLLAAWLTRRRSRDHDAAWLAACSLSAALVAAHVFQATSIPGEFPAWTNTDGRHFFQPITDSGNLVQPGFLLWFLTAGMIAFAFSTRSRFAQLAGASGLVLVISLGFCGAVSKFLWRNVPVDIVGIIAIAYDLRLVPVLAVVGIVGGFYWLDALSASRPRLGRAAYLGLLILLPWTLWEHAVVLYNIRNFHIDVEQTAIRNRSENVPLERYSWDLLPPPRFMSFGVMDPAVETRFWSDSDLEKPAIDADRMEQVLEEPGAGAIDLTATQIPTGKEWLTLDPPIELDPGQHVLLRFDFLGHQPDGFLIVKGREIYREYHLPTSGRDYAFGFEPGNTHTLPLWNTGEGHESVRLLIARGGPNRFDTPAPGPFWRMHLAQFDLKRAPIELESLIPLRLRVDAPTSGYVETFRSLIPGYKVYVDGQPAVVHRSRNALVSVRVTPGRHDIWVRFAGTERLHTAIRWAVTAWLIAAAAAAAQIAGMVRAPIGPRAA